MAELIGYGTSLANSLLPAPVFAVLEKSRIRQGDDEGLRIQLWLDTFALVGLPCELPYAPKPDVPAGQAGPDGFLVLDRRVSLVRHEVLGAPPGTLEPVCNGGPRLAAIVANPAAAGFAILDLERERKSIADALQYAAGIGAIS